MVRTGLEDRGEQQAGDGQGQHGHGVEGPGAYDQPADLPGRRESPQQGAQAEGQGHRDPAADDVAGGDQQQGHGDAGQHGPPGSEPPGRRHERVRAQPTPAPAPRSRRWPTRLALGPVDHVGQQHGPGHRPDAAGHRCEVRRDLAHLVGDVADDPGLAVRPTTRVVPTSSTTAPGPHHVGRDQPGTAGRADHDVSGPDDGGQVAGAGVARGHGGVLGAPGEQQPERPPARRTAPHDHHVRAVERDVVPAEQLDDPARGARQRGVAPGGDIEHQPAEVRRVQAVRVLVRVDPGQHGLLVQTARQGQLHDEPGAGRVGVQLVDDGLDVGLGRVRRQLALDGGDADGGTVAVLASDVRMAAGVVTDDQRAESRHDARRAQPADPLGQLHPNRRRCCRTVQEGGRHAGHPSTNGLKRRRTLPRHGPWTRPTRGLADLEAVRAC